jgi:hypothetical protein
VRRKARTAQEGNLDLREPRKHGLGRSEGGSSDGVRSAKAGGTAMAVSMSSSARMLETWFLGAECAKKSP